MDYPRNSWSPGRRKQQATPSPRWEATHAVVNARLAVSQSTWQQVREPLAGHTGGVSSVAFSPDGTKLASAGDDDTIRLWDVSSRRLIGAPLGGHTDSAYEVVFSPDGTRMASASYDGTVRLWSDVFGTWMRPVRLPRNM